jgi:hypothetical protein
MLIFPGSRTLRGFVITSSPIKGCIFLFPWCNRASSISRFQDHTQTQQTTVVWASCMILLDDTHKYTNKTHSVLLIWTSDQLVAETSTWQHTILTTDRHPYAGGNRTRNPSLRAAAHGHWDGPSIVHFLTEETDVQKTKLGWLAVQHAERTSFSPYTSL